MFRELAVLRSSGENTYSVGYDRRGYSQSRDFKILNNGSSPEKQ
jgi:hypothetical protein